MPEDLNGQYPSPTADPVPSRLIITWPDADSGSPTIAMTGRIGAMQLAGIARWAGRMSDVLMNPLVAQMVEQLYGSKLVLPR